MKRQSSSKPVSVMTKGTTTEQRNEPPEQKMKAGLREEERGNLRAWTSRESHGAPYRASNHLLTHYL